MDIQSLHRQFVSPSAQYRGKPFWSWNGSLDRAELIRQIHVMKEMGFGGFFMHSRTGLATEYLGEEWFELINACADEAERLGMEAWLYDEDRWPSGTAGGMVTVDPAYRMKSLIMHTAPASEFVWRDGLVAVFACQLDGVTYRDARRIDSRSVVRPDETVLSFQVEEMPCHSFYNGATYLDTLNPAATKRFIELTHERYAARCGDRLGRSIRGIFTDEPHRGALMDPFGSAHPGRADSVPFTDRLFDRFGERHGYGLVERLPELFLVPAGQPVSQVKWHFVDLVQDLFHEAFAQPIQRWCDEHGMLLTGHVLQEDSLAAQTSMIGSIMRFYEFMHVPGIDLLTEGNRAFWVAKQLQSAARQLGQKWLLSELYGCTGWQMGFAGHKAVGDWQALFGVNLRCHHLSWYTMEGEAKRDFPGSILDQCAWWRDYDYVETYFARLGLFQAQGSRICDVLVLNPVESVWSMVHSGWCRYLGATDPAIGHLEKSYADLFHWLQGDQIDFDYADEAMLARMGSVVDGQNGPLLNVGLAGYRAVVVSGMVTLRSSTLRMLEEFAASGGMVLFVGDVPGYVDAMPSADPAELASRATRLAPVREAVVDALSMSVGRVAGVVDEAGSPVHDVYCRVHRDADGVVYVMALNVDRARSFPSATVRIARRLVSDGAGAEEWSASSGARRPVAARWSDDWVSINTSFAPAGERLWVLGAGCDSAAPQAPDVEVVRRRIEGPYSITLSEPNVCVLDVAEWRVDGGPWQPADEILKIDRRVRDHFGLPHRGGAMLQPWYIAKSSHEPLGTVELRFPFAVERMPLGPLTLAIERLADCALRANGAPLDARPTGERWVDNCFHCIPLDASICRQGDNRIEVAVRYHEGMGLEALYLIGAFGVAIDGWHKRLVELPTRLHVGDVTTQGLPFYSGAITYRLPIGDPCKAGAARLTLGRHEGACAKMLGPPYVMIAWPPYEADVTSSLGSGAVELELVLTRRNTFGPLHQLPVRAPGYSPESFTTDGPAFSLDYALHPAGLLEPPSVAFYRRG